MQTERGEERGTALGLAFIGEPGPFFQSHYHQGRRRRRGAFFFGGDSFSGEESFLIQVL